MNTAFEKGFIKAAQAKGFTVAEAQLLLKSGMIPPGNLQGAMQAGPMQLSPKPMQNITMGAAPKPMMPQAPKIPQIGAPGTMPKGPLSAPNTPRI